MEGTQRLLENPAALRSFLQECSFAALLGFLGWGWANMSTEKWCIYDNLKHLEEITSGGAA